MSEMLEKLLIRNIRREEWKQAIRLVWRTFLKFDAPYYNAQGIRTFYDFITDERLYQMFTIGSLQVCGGYIHDMLIGVIALRNEGHISLLFIDEDYQKQGIGAFMVKALLRECKKASAIEKVTVNASLYAIGFYHRMGFFDTGNREENDGIISVPMAILI